MPLSKQRNKQPATRRRGGQRLGRVESAANGVICRSLHVLASWGFSLAPPSPASDVTNAFEAVAEAAARLLQRTDAEGRQLGHKRMEQLYRVWVKDQAGAGEWNGLVPSFNRWQVQSLRQRRPWATRGLSLQELADKLVSSKGYWLEPEDPGEMDAPPGDMLLTKKAHEEYLRIRPRLCGVQRLVGHES